DWQLFEESAPADVTLLGDSVQRIQANLNVKLKGLGGGSGLSQPGQRGLAPGPGDRQRDLSQVPGGTGRAARGRKLCALADAPFADRGADRDCEERVPGAAVAGQGLRASGAGGELGGADAQPVGVGAAAASDRGAGAGGLSGSGVQR